MIRTFLAVCLFSGTLCAIALGGATGQQPAEKRQPAKGKFDPPELHPPDAATLKAIAEKTEQLRKAIANLKEKKIKYNVLSDVEIYLKAAENIVRFEEWYSKDSTKWALTTLDRGLDRANQAARWEFKQFGDNQLGDNIWQATTGKWNIRAFYSRIDGSVQPYAVCFPEGYGKDINKSWPLDVVLHGRDSSLTEAKFIANHDGKAGPKGVDRILLEVYGRGNNAYRWAGEIDVYEAIEATGHRAVGGEFGTDIIDDRRVVLRGFSMGGAGAWHFGLHYPDKFCVIGPGAGFTTTHGYVGDLPAKLPDYQEKCLHIYDAVDYAENAFNVPIVAYSGALDEQKAAADNIEKLLKGFNEPFKFKHIIAPGLKHEQPKEWLDKLEVEYKAFREKGRDKKPNRVRFVTYTPRYWYCEWIHIGSLEKMYEKATVDGNRDKNSFTIATANIRSFSIDTDSGGPIKLTIDGQTIDVPKEKAGLSIFLHKAANKWSVESLDQGYSAIGTKYHFQMGPIDDAFCRYFCVINPAQPGWHVGTDAYAKSATENFARIWDRHFRAKLPVRTAVESKDAQFGRIQWTEHPHVVLFGDPASNPEIAKVLPKLPLTWTKEKLVVNGVEYDSRTHLPVMIYPHPQFADRYVVINSGHTFKEADLKGTNALLYPRLGDWAVIKPTPTAKDPAAYEVVAAGLFDENWQFPKK